MAEVDSRIHIVKGPGKGVVRNFENAIRHCNGDIIYLSDQDDIWKPDKVEKVNYAFSNPEVKAVLHDAEIVDENGVATGAASLFSIRGSRAGILKNLLKNSYVGCCMAFRKELIPIICPIPNEMYTEITFENLESFREFKNKRDKKQYWKLLSKEIDLIDAHELL